MSSFFPTRHLSIVSRLNPEQSHEALRARIRTSVLPSFSRDANKVFRGEVRADGFQVSLIPKGRNAWMPRCKGQVQPHESGSRVEVDLLVHPLALALTALWVAVAIAGAGFGVTLHVTRGAPLATLAPLGILPLFLLGAWGAYSVGLRQSEAELRDTFTD